MTPSIAIANNHAWYLSIFDAHDLPSELHEHYWSTDAQPPPYYSHLVTRTSGAVAREAQLRRLAQLATRVGKRGWGCKDSFDALSGEALNGLGLRLLFRAEWYGCAGQAASPTRDPAVIPRRVDSHDALATWEAEWQRSSPTSGVRVFPNRVLDDPNLDLFTLVEEERVVGGFALNRSEGAVGLSNVFRAETANWDDVGLVRACAGIARELHPGCVVVGYGPPSELAALASLGFVALGPLSVWVSP